MKNTEIAPVPYSQKVYSVSDDLNELRTASEKRTSMSSAFKQIEDHAKWLKSQRDIDSYSLNIDKYTQFEDEQKKVSDAFEEMMDKKVNGLNVKNLPEDMAEITKDEGAEARNKDWVEGLEKDIYINEVLSIISDMDKK